MRGDNPTTLQSESSHVRIPALHGSKFPAISLQNLAASHTHPPVASCTWLRRRTTAAAAAAAPALH